MTTSLAALAHPLAAWRLALAASALLVWPLVGAALMLAPRAAAAQDGVATPGNALAAPPSEWLGEAPHLVLMGTLNGRPLDVQVTDPAAEGVARLAAKREYLPGEAEGAPLRYGDFEVQLQAVIGGVERAFEIEVENRDFHAHPLPATFALGGEPLPEGARAFLEMEAEWEDADGSVNDEAGGWAGTLTLHLDDGEADARGVRPSGRIGGHLDATRGTDRLVASFTVEVTDHEIDD